MCIKIEEIEEKLKKYNKERDRNLAEKLAPIEEDLREIKKIKSRLFWGGAGLFTIIFSVGMWVGTIRQDVNHNAQAIASKADLLEQNARINACMDKQNNYEADIRRINDKLDRLIENQAKK